MGAARLHRPACCSACYGRLLLLLLLLLLLFFARSDSSTALLLHGFPLAEDSAFDSEEGESEWEEEGEDGACVH